ncbi:MAG: Crp/Fnr family transcriptional regulator [Caulobacter sp.]|nr:Crp/Fnr family transcriptional regulator [Caulobacter sp.]
MAIRDLGALGRLEQFSWFARQPAEQRRALLQGGHVRSLADGAWAHGEGDEETGLLAVLDGSLRTFARAPGGRSALIGVLPPGAIIGQSALFGGGPRLVTAISAGESLVFVLSDRALRAVAVDHPGLWRDLSQLIYRQLQTMVQSVAELTALPPRVLLASRLLVLSRQGAAVPIGQGELAEMLGISRKTVNGWLSSLATQGLIRQGYGRIEVLDRAGLERIVDREEPGVWLAERLSPVA